MKIETIKISNDGYVRCNSCFYSVLDILSNNTEYSFSVGTNRLCGEIDSGVWAISYLLSMYSSKPKDFVLFEKPELEINGNITTLNTVLQYSCYMDNLYPLFSTKASIRKLVTKGIKANQLDYSTDDIKNLFNIDSERFERPLSCVGNEVFKAMAAIGYCHGKQIFCFPWLSQKRFENYHNNINKLLNTLSCLDAIVVLPIGE